MHIKTDNDLLKHNDIKDFNDTCYDMEGDMFIVYEHVFTIFSYNNIRLNQNIFEIVRNIITLETKKEMKKSFTKEEISESTTFRNGTTFVGIDEPFMI